ncbi:mannose-1-phosphate guanylyltransferase/mannose-6-phosphate isomerase [Lentisphaera profundi]|uniref:Mannose-1-phosphate guanylyltransferase/mannose-6-phosphate isomerase n=1 Tax=Lentisphaera profundi TaxID=1658616 RepID=A0ABY7VQ23_9BACT|nr:mannose-1-phosphate guanylyltransferase/mannose-6-phosphate isomerase [Lentisphaera profundi]WDE96092.1 mannose-1-phosphate guanylyltransferase/mannose-6-phosphate isomerase [Lentisphaera profundi]
MKKLHTVIMSGGAGTRLWPLSRSHYPKQFHVLSGNDTMVQQTAARLDGLKELGSTLVVANEDHRFLVAEQLKHLDNLSIILEPCARNTAPAVALAAFELETLDPQSLMLVLSADHIIRDEDAFRNTVELSRLQAENGSIVTYGIVPDYPATGYGYIQKGEENAPQIFKVDEFVEKPNADRASEYLASGEFLWNSGMFLIRTDIYLEELNKFRPDIFQACKASITQAQRDPDFIRPHKASFEKCPKDSIDYAVMEKSALVCVTPLDAQWSDVGSWSELAKSSKSDLNGNNIIGDAILINTQDTYVKSEKRLIATAGLSNLVIIDTEDAILVADKNASQEIKQIVEQLKASNRPEADTFPSQLD